MVLCDTIVFGGSGASLRVDSNQSSESGIDFDEIAMDYGDLRNDYTSQLLSTPPPFLLPSLPSP